MLTSILDGASWILSKLQRPHPCCSVCPYGIRPLPHAQISCGRGGHDSVINMAPHIRTWILFVGKSYCELTVSDDESSLLHSICRMHVRWWCVLYHTRWVLCYSMYLTFLRLSLCPVYICSKSILRYSFMIGQGYWHRLAVSKCHKQAIFIVQWFTTCIKGVVWGVQWGLGPTNYILGPIFS